MEHRISDIDSAEHYTWGGVCDGWHFLKDPSLSVIQERIPPGEGEALHFHSNARQFFYVLSGAATMDRSDAEVVFLVISSPTTAGDRTNVSAPV